MLMCAGEIFPAICFIKKKKAACFIVNSIFELGLPSSLLLCFSHFPVSFCCFLSPLQALPPFFFLSLRQKMMFAAYGVLIVYYQAGSHMDNYT